MIEALTTLSNWCNENAMIVSTEKTFYQNFILNHKQPKISLKISNKPVIQTQDAKYLGMYLDGKLTRRNHLQKTDEKTKKKLKCFEKACRKQMGSSRSVFNVVYKAYMHI
jgi:hypothetical protein